MALSFPTTPSDGDEHYDAGSKITYIYQASINAWYPKAVFPEATEAEMAAGVSSTKFITPRRGQKYKSLGVEQTWQTPARALGTLYTNTTGRPIAVSVTASGLNMAGYLNLQIAGIAIGRAGVEFNTSGGKTINLFGIVPPGATYQAYSDGVGGVALQNWKELR